MVGGVGLRSLSLRCPARSSSVFLLAVFAPACYHVSPHSLPHFLLLPHLSLPPGRPAAALCYVLEGPVWLRSKQLPRAVTPRSG